MNQLALGLARACDPNTSWEAAKEIAGDITERQLAVLAIFHKHRGLGLTDKQLVILYTDSIGWTGLEDDFKPQSPSGLRTRRRELADRGLLHLVGKRDGCQLWQFGAPTTAAEGCRSKGT